MTVADRNHSLSSRVTCVLLDTNIWRAERLLHSPKAQSLVYTILRREGVLALPEVVEMELPATILKAGRLANQKAVQASREVSDILGEQDCIEDYSDKVFLAALEHRVSELAAIIERVPLTIEIARLALKMVCDKKPPNEREEQFRDSAIWQTAIHLAKKYRVYFVTTDGGFFQQSKEGCLLAQNIREDCDKAGGALSVCRGVAPCLSLLNDESPEVDASLIKSSILSQTAAIVAIELEHHALGHLSDPSVEIHVFTLLTSDRVAVDFTVREFCQPLSADDPRAGAVCEVVALGGCFFSIAQNQISSVHVEKIRVSYRKDGNEGYSAKFLGLRDTTTPISRPDLLSTQHRLNSCAIRRDFVDGDYAPIDWTGERLKHNGPDDFVVRLPVPALELPAWP